MTPNAQLLKWGSLELVILDLLLNATQPWDCQAQLIILTHPSIQFTSLISLFVPQGCYSNLHTGWLKVIEMSFFVTHQKSKTRVSLWTHCFWKLRGENLPWPPKVVVIQTSLGLWQCESNTCFVVIDLSLGGFFVSWHGLRRILVIGFRDILTLCKLIFI